MEKENAREFSELEEFDETEEFDEAKECQICYELIQKDEIHECVDQLECPICGSPAWEGGSSLEYLTCGHLLAGNDDSGFSLQISTLPCLDYWL